MGKQNAERLSWGRWQKAMVVCRLELQLEGFTIRIHSLLVNGAEFFGGSRLAISRSWWARRGTACCCGSASRRFSAAAFDEVSAWVCVVRWKNMGMDQYLYIPFLGGWTSIYQLFWCSPGVQGFDTLPYGNMGAEATFGQTLVNVIYKTRWFLDRHATTFGECHLQQGSDLKDGLWLVMYIYWYI